MATTRQKKLVNIIVENSSNGKPAKPMKQMMVEAGYSPNTAVHPTQIIRSPAVQQELDPFVKKMIELRDVCINLASKKRSGANFSALIDSVDKLTKNIQLLTGGQTENTGLDKYVDSLNLLMAEIKSKRHD